MDDIAKRAGVGPGTLYRHFPTREALLAAVYRDDVELMAKQPPGFASACRRSMRWWPTRASNWPTPGRNSASTPY